MPICIVGSEGNMGRRYAAVLKHLNIFSIGIDVDTSEKDIQLKSELADGFIIATPSMCHEGHAEYFSRFNKPMLIEKPLCIGIPEISIKNTNLINMVCNYRYMAPWDYYRDDDSTYYNYFNSGKDSLVFNCIQIIGLAKGAIRLDSSSAIWKCKINNHTYNIAGLDHSYIAMVKAWLNKEIICSYEEAQQWHHKALEFENTYAASENWNTGPLNFKTIPQ